jgi:hypothetical protein
MKKDEQKEITEPTSSKNAPVEYDGYEDLVEPMETGVYKTSRVKLYLSHSEVKKFMGENDPNKYFREGKVPVYFPKAVGTLLSEDRVETQVKNDAFSKYPDTLMFKHDLTNIYTLLIPKELTEHEFANGDFVDRLVRYDTRSVVFTGGQGRPSSFEVDYFKKHAALIVKKLDAKAEERKIY